MFSVLEMYRLMLSRDNDEEFYQAWDQGRTGYPWIDAIMVQLNQQGWMHHLARHCVVTAPSLSSCTLKIATTSGL